MYDALIEIIHAVMRNGLSLSALGTALFVLLKQRKVKRAIRKRLPWLLRDDADVMNYEARQIRIEEDVRAIKAHLGVSDEWDAHSAQASKSLGETDGQKSSLKPTWAGRVLVPITGAFTSQTVHFNRSKTREGNTRMLKKLDSRKLQMILVPTIINICLLVGYVLDVQDIQSKVEAWTPLINLVVQALLGVIYAVVEGSIDKAKVIAEVSAYDAKNLDLVRQDSEGA